MQEHRRVFPGSNNCKIMPETHKNYSQYIVSDTNNILSLIELL